MSKTPISALQEIMVKNNKSLPVYNCIGERSIGKNNHEFTIRVTCGDISADGKGLTKKEAKQNAAKEMILLENGESQTNSVNNDSMIIESTEEKNSSPVSSVGTNYIGLLHEYCAQYRIVAPTFIEVKAWGPDHQMKFIIRCKVSDIEEEGTATTKKQAKTEAAKKVWFKVSKGKIDLSFQKSFETIIAEKGVEIKNLNLEEILPDYENMNRTAKDKYLNLTQMQTTNLIGDSLFIEDCHRVFSSDRYSIPLRKSIISQLNGVDVENEDISMLPTCRSILDKIAQLLGVKFKKIELFNRTRQAQTVERMSDSNYTIGLKLYTDPIIVSMSSGKTLALAELKAVHDIFVNLKTLLS